MYPPHSHRPPRGTTRTRGGPVVPADTRGPRSGHKDYTRTPTAGMYWYQYSGEIQELNKEDVSRTTSRTYFIPPRSQNSTEGDRISFRRCSSSCSTRERRSRPSLAQCTTYQSHHGYPRCAQWRCRRCRFFFWKSEYGVSYAYGAATATVGALVLRAAPNRLYARDGDSTCGTDGDDGDGQGSRFWTSPEAKPL